MFAKLNQVIAAFRHRPLHMSESEQGRWCSCPLPATEGGLRLERSRIERLTFMTQQMRTRLRDIDQRIDQRVIAREFAILPLHRGDHG